MKKHETNERRVKRKTIQEMSRAAYDNRKSVSKLNLSARNCSRNSKARVYNNNYVTEN